MYQHFQTLHIWKYLCGYTPKWNYFLGSLGIIILNTFKLKTSSIHILEKTPFFVKCVDLHFQQIPIYKHTCEYKLQRNHFLVKHVKHPFWSIPFWKATCKHSLDKDHYSVNFVDDHFLCGLNLEFSCKDTLEKKHFLVKSADQHFSIIYFKKIHWNTHLRETNLLSREIDYETCWSRKSCYHRIWTVIHKERWRQLLYYKKIIQCMSTMCNWPLMLPIFLPSMQREHLATTMAVDLDSGK